MQLDYKDFKSVIYNLLMDINARQLAMEDFIIERYSENSGNPPDTIRDQFNALYIEKKEATREHLFSNFGKADLSDIGVSSE